MNCNCKLLNMVIMWQMNSNYFVALRLLLWDVCNPGQKRSSSEQAELGLESEVLLGFIFSAANKGLYVGKQC